MQDSAFLTAAYSNGEGGATLMLTLENSGYPINGIFEVKSSGKVEHKWSSTYPMFLFSPLVGGDEGRFWTSLHYGPVLQLGQLDAEGTLVPYNRVTLWMSADPFNQLITDHEGGAYLLHSDTNYKSYQVSRFNANATPVWEKPLVIDTLLASDPVTPGFYSDAQGGAYVATFYRNETPRIHRISTSGELLWSTTTGDRIIGIDSMSRMILVPYEPSQERKYAFRHLHPSGQLDHFVDLSLPDYPLAEWAGAYTAPSGNLLLISRGLEKNGWRFFGRLISPTGEDLWGDWRSIMTSTTGSTALPTVSFGPNGEGFYLAFWDEDYINKKVVSHLRMQRVTWAGRNEWLEDGIHIASDARHGSYNEIVVPLDDKVIVAYTEIPLNSEMYTPRVLVTALDKSGAPLGTAAVQRTLTRTRSDYQGIRSVRVHDPLGRLVTKFDASFEDLRQHLARLSHGWYSVSIDHEQPFPFVVAR
ncbi:MAG TPA: hypothetical protein VFH43_14320 [Candidatus Kapabacteria bacterium]|nr:hypothetical protein [Candidatus Kapabacteria bacterium]